MNESLRLLFSIENKIRQARFISKKFRISLFERITITKQMFRTEKFTVNQCTIYSRKYISLPSGGATDYYFYSLFFILYSLPDSFFTFPIASELDLCVTEQSTRKVNFEKN